MSRRRYSKYGYSSSRNYGFNFGRSFFPRRKRRYHGQSKYSLENGLAPLILLLILALTYGSESTRVSLLSAVIPLVSLVIIIILVRYFIQDIQHKSMSKLGIFDIDTMTGEDFEKRLAVLYRNLGYTVKHVGHSGDAGVDLILQKNTERIAVQAKCYSGNVGETAVQQVYTGKTVHQCSEAVIVTNSYFTQMAIKVANTTNVKLINRDGLIDLLKSEHNPNTQSNISITDLAAQWLTNLFNEKKLS